jgi:hypothetical protein
MRPSIIVRSCIRPTGHVTGEANARVRSVRGRKPLGTASFAKAAAQRGPEGESSPARRSGSVGRDAQRGVMMQAAPAAALGMVEPDFLLEVLVVALDTPAHFGDIDEITKFGFSLMLTS